LSWLGRRMSSCGRFDIGAWLAKYSKLLWRVDARLVIYAARRRAYEKVISTGAWFLPSFCRHLD